MECSCAESGSSRTCMGTRGVIGLFVFAIAAVLLLATVIVSANNAEITTIGYHSAKVVLEKKIYSGLHSNSVNMEIKDCSTNKDAIYMVTFGERGQSGVISCSGNMNLFLPSDVDPSTIAVQELIRGVSETHST